MDKLNKIKKTPKAYLKPTSHLSPLTSNKGITLTSLVIYITVMFVVLATIMRVMTYFRKNMTEASDVTFETEFEKLNLYLLDESKKTGNEILEITEGIQITFLSGNKYTYNAENKTINLNDNIKVCENVESCLFEQKVAENGKNVLVLTITINDTTKTFKYVMKDTASENEIIEADYTNSIIAKEYTVSTNSVTINNTIGQNVINYRISGNCYQAGTPTPESPIEIQSVGDLVTDIDDENYGKYLIPITATNGEKTETINIYLDEPLRSITYGSQTATDYIDFETKQIVRNVWQTNIDGNESWGYNRNRKDGANITIRNVNLEKRKLFAYFVLSNKYKNLYALWNNNDSTTDYAWKICDYGGTGIYISLDNETIGVPLEACDEYTGEERDSRTKKVTDYLKTNNFYVIYSIAEPDIQTIDLPELPSFKGTTTYTVGTSLAPINFYVKVSINNL
ncbi:MAG: hypothetical protein ACI4VP_00735 [Clostridia bacterium]